MSDLLNALYCAGYIGASVVLFPCVAGAQVASCTADATKTCMNVQAPGGFGTGGGGGAVTGAAGSFVDGWNLTMGTQATAAWDGAASSATEMAYLRYIAANSNKPLTVTAKRLTLTTAQQLGAGATNKLAYVQCYNPSGAVAYVQVLDANPPTLGTTVPIASFGIAPSQTGGIALGTMAIGVTTALFVASTTTPAGASTVSQECNFGYF